MATFLKINTKAIEMDFQLQLLFSEGAQPLLGPNEDPEHTGEPMAEESTAANWTVYKICLGEGRGKGGRAGGAARGNCLLDG